MIAVLDGLGGSGRGSSATPGAAISRCTSRSRTPGGSTGLILFETLGAIPDGGSAELVVNLVARLTPMSERAGRPRWRRQESGDDDPP